MWQTVKKVAGSRTGQVLYLSNLALALCCFYLSTVGPAADPPAHTNDICAGRFIAGRWVYHDPYLTLPLVCLNFLPMMVSHFIVDRLIDFGPRLSVTALSWVYAYLLVGLASAQWLIVGRYLERIVAVYRGRE